MNLSAPTSLQQLEDALSEPSQGLIQCMQGLAGDLLLIGAGGKMGPTLARMAKRASDLAGRPRRIIAVSRFSTSGCREQLDDWGVETISCDLFDEEQFDQLPAAENVLCMLGLKFGTSAAAARTWATNTYLPALLSRKYSRSRIVAFSTGNVYPLVPVSSSGSKEQDPLNPVGEYGMSALGRERIFEHFCREQKTPMTLLRLNYACECRYGVLVDLAQRIISNQPVSLGVARFNVLWQGDANAYALQAFETTASPPTILNMTGPEILHVRQVAEVLGQRMGKQVRFEGAEGPTALLNDAHILLERFGMPRVSANELVDWVAAWVAAGNVTLNKPTHFEVSDGQF